MFKKYIFSQRRKSMAKDLIIKSEDLAITLNVIGKLLKADGKNQGGYGFLSDGSGVFHILVQDADSARHILESNKISVLEEQDVWVIIAEHGDNAILKLNGVIGNTADNFYLLKVPDNGAVEIKTRISSDDDTEDAGGCSHIFYAILHSLGLTK
jgi:hypothetical protein